MESIDSYFTARELAERWNISVRMISHYCSAGLLEGAVKKGRIWFIPKQVQRPVDHRYRENKERASDV